ncbi:hypothetical protein C440_05627 [Haloferax mucosum ATCC BAA-1512]|uniref:Uncharacterized protein n=1 Tax=Haloferax mucosum ATCC BAA-1512 TaxID=662479 RepID=M0IH03_9EURY|nr:hypothetical protein [Haloferax mucosum]ELZ96045.1 hypothetical protein C440_05627 [Haloferax mucosum ATCC BAA-1512]
MSPLAFHIAAHLTSDSAGVDHKAKFGRYVNEQPDFARSRYMPDLVRDNITDVARHEFTLSPPATPADQDPIPRGNYREFWLDALESEPWDIYSIAEAMADRFDINTGWAFKTARQHLNQLVLQARMRGYREQPLAGRRFRWSGPEADHPACAWIQEQVPSEGLPYHKLVDLMQEAKQRFVENPPASTHVVHDWCRHEIREVR